MKTYIVLFRGINVGGKNILRMNDLVALLEENKYQNVKTYIQSGNVVLKSKSNPELNIGKLISSNFGFKPDILALEKSTFLTNIKNNPYQTDEGKTVHFFL